MEKDTTQDYLESFDDFIMPWFSTIDSSMEPFHPSAYNKFTSYVDFRDRQSPQSSAGRKYY